LALSFNPEHVMNKLPPRNILVAAALVGIAAENAWSEESTPSVPAAAAEQTAPPEAGYVPRYAPGPDRGGYAQRWQPPPWPAPPPGYGQFPPYYPPYGQYPTAPAVPTENPLSVELKQTQEQLNTKSTELNTANEQLATVQAELQATREALQQAQSVTVVASQQLSTAMEQADSLRNMLIEVKSRLDAQNTGLMSEEQAAAADNDNVDSAVASDAEPAQPAATTSAQPGGAASEEAEVSDTEQTKPEAQ
jgi:hypothetical protein